MEKHNCNENRIYIKIRLALCSILLVIVIMILAFSGLDSDVIFILIVVLIVIFCVPNCISQMQNYDHFCSLCGEKIGKSGQQFTFYIRKADLK